MTRRPVAVLLGAVAVFAMAQTARADAAAVPVVALHGVLTGADADRVERTIVGAVTAGTPCVVLDVDSPGGGPQVIQRLVNAVLGSGVPVIAFVGAGGHADAGALYVLEAAAVVGAAPSAELGATHALDLGDYGFAAVANGDSAAVLGQLATTHGRASAWVTSVAAHGGSTDGVDALRRHAVDSNVDNVTALLKSLDGVHIGSSAVALASKDVTTQDVVPEGWDSLTKTLARPDVAYALLVVSVLCLGILFAHPAGMVMGLVALATGAGAIDGFLNLPTNRLGLALVGLSFVLFVVDIKAVTHGGLTAAGSVAMALGGWRLVDTGTLNAGVSVSLVVITVVAITAAYGTLVPKLVAARRLPYGDPQGDLVGRVATVRERLAPHGYIVLDGTLWKATATHSPQPEGARVRVVEIQGLRLTVEPAPSTTPNDANV